MEEDEIIEVPKDPEKEKIYKAVEDITKIISKYSKENEIKEEIINEIISYINQNNLDCTIIKDRSRATLAHHYCVDLNYFHLKIYLLSIERILSDKNKIKEYLLIEDISHLNIFESASEIGDSKIFDILSKYLENNYELLSSLVYQEKNNIFHISARENKIISLLFYHEFYKNDISVLNNKNKSTWTPLMIACYKGNYEYVQTIINLGADYKILDKENKNALFYAVESHNSRIVKYLILIGINKNQLDSKKKKAVSYSDDPEIHRILDDKTLFELIFKCPLVYQSLKGHFTHIYYLVLLLFLILIQLIILISFRTVNKKENCSHYFYTIRFSYETFFIILSFFAEMIGVLFYFFFHYSNKKINPNMYSTIIDNQKKLYDLYLSNQNLCVKCKKIITIGTQHCISCDKCIDNWDHHCFWLNVCIESKNKKYFKIFMIQLFIIIIMNFIVSVFFNVDIIRYPKLYYGFLSKCTEDQSFNFISFICLVIFITYLFADLYFLYVALLPYLIEFLCSPSTEIEKLIITNTDSSEEVKHTPLISNEDNNV